MENILLLIIISSFVLVGVLFPLNRRYSARRILERWCKKRDYTLEKKKRIFWNLFSFGRHMRYEITVIDENRNMKSGKATIGSFWFGLSTRKVRVTWY